MHESLQSHLLKAYLHLDVKRRNFSKWIPDKFHRELQFLSLNSYIQKSSGKDCCVFLHDYSSVHSTSEVKLHKLFLLHWHILHVIYTDEKTILLIRAVICVVAYKTPSCGDFLKFVLYQASIYTHWPLH